MSSLCMALGATALRPAATATARTTAKARAANLARRPMVTFGRPLGRSFDHGFGAQTSGYPSGFPPMPPPSDGAPAAYANDYAAPTNTGGPTVPPPTVEWDARNTNSVTLIGNTGMNPEMTEFGSGACVARVSLAVRGKKRMDDAMGADAMGAEEGADTTWIDVEAWNEEARQLCEHVGKGRQIQVTGRLKENTWIDKQTGQKRSRIKVSAYSFAFVAPYGGAGAAASDPYGQQSNPYQQQQAQQPAAAPPAAVAAAAPAYGGAAGGEKDDLWRDLVNNPDAWWDNRARKAEPGGNPRYPDFKHKDSQTPLWIESRDTPQWAVDALQGDGGAGAAAGAAMAAVDDGFDPYYADQGDQGYPPAGQPDYSQPYGAGPAEYGTGGFEGQAGGVAYEPAKPFDDDEPPF